MLQHKLLLFSICCIFSSLSLAGQSFEAFRFRSGMTPKQAQSVAPGYELRWSDAVKGAAFLVKNTETEEPDIYASLSFCQNRLVAVVRQIDPDTDFIRYLDERLRDLGQPKVAVKTQPWTGTGGGDIQRVEFTWISKSVRQMVSFSPEGRTGSGELRHFRSASVSFSLEESPCTRK